MRSGPSRFGNADDRNLTKSRRLGKCDQSGKRASRRHNVIEDQKLVRTADEILVQKIASVRIDLPLSDVQPLLQFGKAGMGEDLLKRETEMSCGKLRQHPRLIKAVNTYAFRLSRREAHGIIRKRALRHLADQIGKLPCHKALQKGIIFELEGIHELARKRVVIREQVRGKADLPSQLSGDTAAFPFRFIADRANVPTQLLIFAVAILAENRVLIGVGQGPFANNALTNEEKSFQKIIHTAS